jgi:acyl carrier protein
LVEAMEYAQVFAFRYAEITDDFLAGKADMTIEELALDSLSSIEFCIAIENKTGVSILLTDLWDIGSLQNLAARIQRGS